MVGKFYRKKPVVVEATQWFFPGDHESVKIDSQGRPYIETLEGVVPVAPGDWIIKEVTGACLCRPDVFEQTYEPAEEPKELKAVFEHFDNLSEAKEFHGVCGGYLLRGTEGYVICDEERAIEFLILKAVPKADAESFLKHLANFGFDETAAFPDRE